MRNKKKIQKNNKIITYHYSQWKWGKKKKEASGTPYCQEIAILCLLCVNQHNRWEWKKSRKVQKHVGNMENYSCGPWRVFQMHATPSLRFKNYLAVLRAYMSCKNIKCVFHKKAWQVWMSFFPAIWYNHWRI